VVDDIHLADQFQEHRLRVFEYRVLRKTLEAKREEIRGE
jgi:hypothetical protein